MTGRTYLESIGRRPFGYAGDKARTTRILALYRAGRVLAAQRAIMRSIRPQEARK